MDLGAGSGGAVGREKMGPRGEEPLEETSVGTAGRSGAERPGVPAHLQRRPHRRGQHGSLLLVLLLLKLLGQLQVAKTCRALRLLLQGQGDQVVLERGGEKRSSEVARGLWDAQPSFRFPNPSCFSFTFTGSPSRTKSTAKYIVCGDREHTAPNAQVVRR